MKLTGKVTAVSEGRVTISGHHVVTSLPFAVGDVVSATIEDELFVYSPLVVIPYGEKSVKAFLKTSSRLDLYGRFKRKTIALLEQLPSYTNRTPSESVILSVADSLPEAVFETISMYAFLFRRSRDIKWSLVKELQLPFEQLTEVLDRWYDQVSIRSLLLLGLTRDEITLCLAHGWDRDSIFFPEDSSPSSLRKQLLDVSPFTVEGLPLEKALLLSRHYSTRFPDSVLRAAEYIRTVQNVSPITEQAKSLRSTLQTVFGCSFTETTLLNRRATVIEAELNRLNVERKLSSHRVSMLCESRTTPEQRQAVENALNYSVSVVTGRPGTGKSFVGEEIKRELGRRSLLALFSHELYKQSPDCILIDGELSRERIAKLCYRYPHPIRKVLLGTSVELPSVPSVHLDRDLRRRRDGALKRSAESGSPEFGKPNCSDCIALSGGAPLLVKLLSSLRDQKVDRRDIKIIARGGELVEINLLFTKLFSGSPSFTDGSGVVWRVGDRIRLRRDEGEIVGIDGSVLKLLLSGREVTIERTTYLTHASASTLKNSERGEWEIVIVLSDGSFTKQELHAALNRARDRFYLIAP